MRDNVMISINSICDIAKDIIVENGGRENDFEKSINLFIFNYDIDNKWMFN